MERPELVVSYVMNEPIPNPLEATRIRLVVDLMQEEVVQLAEELLIISNPKMSIDLEINSKLNLSQACHLMSLAKEHSAPVVVSSAELSVLSYAQAEGLPRELIFDNRPFVQTIHVVNWIEAQSVLFDYKDVNLYNISGAHANNLRVTARASTSEDAVRAWNLGADVICTSLPEVFVDLLNCTV
jgi:hypothetical protein